MHNKSLRSWHTKLYTHTNLEQHGLQTLYQTQGRAFLHLLTFYFIESFRTNMLFSLWKVFFFLFTLSFLYNLRKKIFAWLLTRSRKTLTRKYVSTSGYSQCKPSTERPLAKREESRYCSFTVPGTRRIW